MPCLDIVIVNWNAGKQLAECLMSIAAANQSGFEYGRIVVVDNGSTDGSVDGLNFPTLPLTILPNRMNLGFAAACNQGAALGRGDYILFLNPDVRLEPQALERSVQWMELHRYEHIGICGIQLVNEQGTIARSCARFPSFSTLMIAVLGFHRLAPLHTPGYAMTDWDHHASRLVDHVIGAFYLVRRSLFEQLKGFDERFFVYLEDLDFSFRAHLTGWHSYYLADAHAYHKGGGVSEQAQALRLFYHLRSRIRYARKHFPLASAALITLATLFIEPGARLLLALVCHSGTQVQDTLRAYGLLWSALLHREQQIKI